MNWKLVLIGGLAFYLASWLVSPITMPLIHEGVLAKDYESTVVFWRPELITQNITALLPRWIVTGLIGAFITAGIYGWIRSALVGAGWLRGLKFGAALSLLSLTFMLAWSGVFNLPDRMWAWWAVDSTTMLLVASTALGWIAEKVAPVAVHPSLASTGQATAGLRPQ